MKGVNGMLLLKMFLNESYPMNKKKKYILLDKNNVYLRCVYYDQLDFAEREIIPIKDLPNEIDDNLILIKFNIGKKKYRKIMDRKLWNLKSRKQKYMD